MPSEVSIFFRDLEATLGDLAAAVRFQHGALVSQTRFLKRTVLRQKDTLNQVKIDLDLVEAQKQELAQLRDENAQLRRALAENNRPHAQAVEGSAKRKQRISPGSHSSTGSRVPARLSLPPPERRSPTLKDQLQQYSFVPVSASRSQAAAVYSSSLSEAQMPPPPRPTFNRAPPIRRVFRNDPSYTTPVMTAAPTPRQPLGGTPRPVATASRSIAPNAMRPADHPQSSVAQQRAIASRTFRPDLGAGSGPKPSRPRGPG